MRTRSVIHVWKASLVLLTACTAALCQGCREPSLSPPAAVEAPKSGTPPPATVPAIQPKWVFLEGSVKGVPFWSEPFQSLALRQKQALSPGGSNILVTLKDPGISGASGASVAVLSFTDQWHHPTVFFSADENWMKNYNVMMPLGWVADFGCLFVVGYEQIDGPHVGRRGISIRQGDLRTGKAEETGFIDLANGILHSADFVKDLGKAYFHVSGSIWEYDAADRELRNVKDNLPAESALFRPALSPQRESFVCGYDEPGKAGVYLMDAATGEETELLPAGEAFSFYPQWSPDGKWVSALTVGRKPGAIGSGLDAYDVYPAEDGPTGAARRLTVKNPADGTTLLAEAGGKLISWGTWSIDSKKLYFLAGEPGSVGIHGPDITYDSLYCLDVNTGRVVKIADLGALSDQLQGPIRHIYPVGGTERGVILNVRSGDASDPHYSVWYVEEGNLPRKIEDGEWEVPFGVASCGGTMAGFVRSAGDYSFWVVGPQGPQELVDRVVRVVCSGETFTRFDLLTWDRDRVFAVASNDETGRSVVMGFRVR